MIKNFLFFIVMAAFLISCSTGDKFGASSKYEIEFDVFYGISKCRGKPCIYAYADISPRDGEDVYYYYYWVMDGERLYKYDNEYMEKTVSYGEHFLEFVLIDSFGDTLSDSGIIRVDEPLKITLLSPIEEYRAAKTDTIKFQYKISGIDTWEENPQTVVYVSTDENVWENGKPIKDNFLLPPLNERVYYWGVKAITKQDTTFSETKSEEIRSVWIKN